MLERCHDALARSAHATAARRGTAGRRRAGGLRQPGGPRGRALRALRAAAEMSRGRSGGRLACTRVGVWTGEVVAPVHGRRRRHVDRRGRAARPSGWRAPAGAARSGWPRRRGSWCGTAARARQPRRRRIELVELDADAPAIVRRLDARTSGASAELRALRAAFARVAGSAPPRAADRRRRAGHRQVAPRPPSWSATRATAAGAARPGRGLRRRRHVTPAAPGRGPGAAGRTSDELAPRCGSTPRSCTRSPRRSGWRTASAASDRAAASAAARRAGPGARRWRSWSTMRTGPSRRCWTLLLDVAARAPRRAGAARLRRAARAAGARPDWPRRAGGALLTLGPLSAGGERDAAGRAPGGHDPATRDGCRGGRRQPAVPGAAAAYVGEHGARGQPAAGAPAAAGRAAGRPRRHGAAGAGPRRRRGREFGWTACTPWPAASPFAELEAAARRARAARPASGARTTARCASGTR